MDRQVAIDEVMGWDGLDMDVESQLADAAEYSAKALDRARVIAGAFSAGQGKQTLRILVGAFLLQQADGISAEFREGQRDVIIQILRQIELAKTGDT